MQRTVEDFAESESKQMVLTDVKVEQDCVGESEAGESPAPVLKL